MVHHSWFDGTKSGPFLVFIRCRQESTYVRSASWRLEPADSRVFAYYLVCEPKLNRCDIHPISATMDLVMEDKNVPFQGYH